MIYTHSKINKLGTKITKIMKYILINKYLIDAIGRPEI